MVALGCTTFLIAFAIFMFSRRKPTPRADSLMLEQVSARLERIEQAVDAIAIEVERVSEGQRFTSKILAEKEAVPGRVPGRVVTPH